MLLRNESLYKVLIIDDIPAGQTPHTVLLMSYNDLVDAVHPGERVTVTGIYRAIPVQVNPRISNVRSIYRTYIDVVHFRKLDSDRLHVNEEGYVFYSSLI